MAISLPLTATGAGFEIRRPLAAVISGGLISSRALTLIILPVVCLPFNHDRTTTGAEVE